MPFINPLPLGYQLLHEFWSNYNWFQLKL